MTDGRWLLNGGDVRAGIETMSAAGREGALLSVNEDGHFRRRMREAGVNQEGQAALLRRAWEATVGALPPLSVGRRVAWTQFDFALDGTQLTLAPLGRRVLAALAGVVGPTECGWHLVFIEVFSGEPARTFCCDPGYDLAAVEGKSAIAWVKPYAGDDWRLSQRYPTVTLLPTKAEA